MSAIVTNLDQAAALDNTDMTLAAVAGADHAFPTDGGSQRGIDGTTNCQQLTNESNSLVANDWYSGYVTFASKDMSSVDQAFCMHFKNNSPSYNTILDIRVALRSGAGTANWGVWNVGASATIKNGSFHPIIMFGTPDSEVGTFDNTDVTGFAFLAQASETGGAFGFQISVDQLVHINGPARFGDTGAAATVTLEDYYDLLKPTSGTTYHSMLVARAGPTIELGYPIAIESDDYDDTSAALGIAFKEDDGVAFGVMPAGYYQLEITGQAGGSIVIESASLATNSTDFDLTIDGSAASTSIAMTAVLMAGVRNVSVTGSGVTMTGCTLASPATCEIADGNLDITVNNSTAAIDWSAGLVAGSTITTNSDIDITFAETDLSDINVVLTASTELAVNPTTGSGTYDLSLLTTTGTVTLDNDTANNTTITLAAGTSNTVASPTTGGGTITVDSPAVTFTFTSDTASTLIRYFEDDSQTVVDSTTGTSLAYEYPDADPVDAEFLRQGYVPVNRQDVVPSDGGTLDIIMDFDEAYNASHGLVITTDYTYNRVTKALSIVADQDALDVRSALADLIRTNSSYYNTPLLMVAIPGLTRVDLTDGMTVSSMATWKGAGMERFDSADAANPVEKWFAIKSVGTITGATVHYRQTSSGDSIAVNLTNNVVNEAFQYYRDDNHDGDTSDTNEYDYSGYMVIKSFLAGSKQGRVDVPANAGLSALKSNLYTVPLSNASHDYAGTDPGITADITLITGSTVGGVAFSYEIVDGGTNTGENIADQLNYNAANNPNTVISGGTGLRYFELPDMVIHNASSVETERGYREGATPTLVGFYVSRGGNDHPDFTRFQGDDGSYYTPTVVNQATITNLPIDGGNIMLQIYNTTTATEIYAADPGGATYSDTYTEGGDYSEGDEIRIRFSELNGSTSFKRFSTVVTAGATGWSINAANFIESDSVYAQNAQNGSAITKFTYSPVDDEFNLAVAQNFTAAELFAYYCFVLTTAAGIEGAYGAFVAIDAGNYLNITSIANIFLDNETTASQRQTDSARIYKDDGSYPVRVPTASGYGIDINWQNVVYVVTVGDGPLTTAQQAELSQAAQAASVNTKIGTPSATVSDDIAAIPSAPSAAQNADALLDRNLAGGSDGGRTVKDALRANRNRVEIDADGGTITVYEEDDSTAAWTGAVTTGQRDPINEVDPS